VEQRYQAVLEVLNEGAAVVDVARRYGVARQTVHVWLRAYAAQGWSLDHPAAVVGWLLNDLAARQALVVVWLERGASSRTRIRFAHRGCTNGGQIGLGGSKDDVRDRDRSAQGLAHRSGP
jgi:transposase